MLKSLKDTEYYNEIKTSEEYIILGYYLKSDVIVTKDNVDFITEIEIANLKNNIQNINITLDLDEYINKTKNHILGMIDDYYKEVHYISLNKDTINEYDLVEQDENFYGWLI